MGFIERLPFKIDGDSAFGPGIYDMKGGAYLAYHAFRQICADGARSPLGITQLYVSDEEIGSPTSRALIEAEGRKAKYVLVTEPARDGGKIVTGRKGVARFEVFIKGVPSHAGTRPEDGRSAIRELGNVIQALEAMNDLKRGVTVNVGVVRGGTKPNVIAEEAYAEVDMRVPTIADADELVPKILDLKSTHRRRQRQGRRRTEPPALREGQCRRRALRARQNARGRDRLRSGRHLDRRRLRRQFHRAAYRNARRPRRRRQGRAYPLRADVHFVDRAAGAAAASAVPDAAMTAHPRDSGDRDAPPDDGASAHARGSFFGRRKGHKLRIHQADLIDNLLPHLALDIATARAGRPRRSLRWRRRRCQARNRIRRRRASDRRSAGLSAISASSAASPMSTAWQRS